MIRTAILSICAALSLASIAQASVVTLSGGRDGPVVIFEPGGVPHGPGEVLDGGLIRLGTLTNSPSHSGIRGIDAVFQEFATGFTHSNGTLSQTFNNASASEFDGDQIYIWVFNTDSAETATSHGLFSVADPFSPTTGNPWLFPNHTGSGTDSTTISLGALLDEGSTYWTPARIDPADGGRLILVPESSSGLLAGIAGILIAFRRRR